MSNPVGSITDRSKDGPIKWGALNLTLFSGLTLSIGTILTWWGGVFKELFGYEPQEHPGAAAAIFVGLVAAIGLIVAADLLTRGIAASHVGDSASLPEGLKAKVNKEGSDEVGYTALAIRVAASGSELLLVKDAKATWYPLGSKNEQAELVSA